MKNNDKILGGIENLKSLVDKSLHDPINQILKDYKVKIKRLDKIVIQGDRQQIAFLKLNDELKETSKKLRDNQKVVEKAKEIAELATQSKSDFLANMSHEIRTPMNAILGMSYLALQTDKIKQKDDYINKVHGAAESLLGIINDILDFSKIESGKMTIEYTAFILEDIFEHLQSVLSFKTDEKKLDLVFKSDSKIPPNLKGDPLRLGQILINLANNAVKFTDQGSITIESQLIDTENDKEQIKIKFSVTDTGIGISKVQQKQLFHAFTQADSSTTRKYGGTGLGLSISKQLVDLMQGDIWVETKEGQGSSFIFTFVFDRCTEDEISQISIKQQNNLENTLQQLVGAHVLLVEDNELNQELATELLKSKKITLDIANNGQQAIDMIKQSIDVTADTKSIYNAVLMDIQMPVMGGYEASKILRQTFTPQQLTIIAMTANVMDSDIKNIFACGMNDFISKPIDIKKMFVTLGKWITVDNLKASVHSTQIEKINESTQKEISIGLFDIFNSTGIDLQTGLNHTQNDTKLYHKILVKFLQQSQDFLEQFNCSEINSNLHFEHQKQQRMAHSLKSSAGNIGAKALYRLCHDLENACCIKENQQTIVVKLDKVIIELEPIIHVLKKYLSEYEKTNILPDTALNNINLSQYKTDLLKLQDLIAYGDSDALDILEKLITDMPKCIYTKILDEIKKNLNNYDFDKGLTIINKLLSDYIK